MTIRLRCTECKRKLKVPDAALGKKVQCPACGARFRGRIEPVLPTMPTAIPIKAPIAAEASPGPVELTAKRQDWEVQAPVQAPQAPPAKSELAPPLEPRVEMSPGPEVQPSIQPLVEAPTEPELAPPEPAQPEATVIPSVEQPPLEPLAEIPAEPEIAPLVPTEVATTIAPEEPPLAETLAELPAEPESAPLDEPMVVLPADSPEESPFAEPLLELPAEPESALPVEPLTMLPTEAPEGPPFAELQEALPAEPPEGFSEPESPPFAQLLEETVAEPELTPPSPAELVEAVNPPEETPALLPLPETPVEPEGPVATPAELAAAVHEPEAQPTIPSPDEIPAEAEIAPDIEPLLDLAEEPELVSPVAAEPAESISPTEGPALAQGPAERPAEPESPPLTPGRLLTTIDTEASSPAVPAFVVVSTEEEMAPRVEPKEVVPSQSHAQRPPALTEFFSTISTFEEQPPFPLLPQTPAGPAPTASPQTEPAATSGPLEAQPDTARREMPAEAELAPAVEPAEEIPADLEVQPPAPPVLEITPEPVLAPPAAAGPRPAVRMPPAPPFQPPAEPAAPMRSGPGAPLPVLAEVPLVDVLFAQMALMSGTAGGPRPAPLPTSPRPVNPVPQHGSNETRPAPTSPAHVPVETSEPIGYDEARPQIEFVEEAAGGHTLPPVATALGHSEDAGEQRPPQLQRMGGGKGIGDVHHRIWQRMEESQRQKAGQGSRVGPWAGALAVLLIIGAGIGYAVYSWINADTPPDEWVVFQTPDRVCIVSMPGTPAPTEAGDGKIQKYTLTRPQDQLTFVVQCQDVDPALGRPNIDDITRNEMDARIRESGGKEIKLAPVASGVAEAREVAMREANGEVAVTRIYLVLVGSRQRLYQATIRGPQVRPGEGDAARFLRSVVLTPGRYSLPARAN